MNCKSKVYPKHRMGGKKEKKNGYKTRKMNWDNSLRNLDAVLGISSLSSMQST